MAPRTATERRGRGRGGLCVFHFIADLLSFNPPPLLPFFPQFIYLSITPKMQPTPFPSTFPSFFFFFFSGGENPCLVFPFWCFVAGPVVNLRLRRPRELGDRAFRTAASPPLKKALDVLPQLLSNGNVVLIRNRKRASVLCVCSAVLIYLDLR